MQQRKTRAVVNAIDPAEKPGDLVLDPPIVFPHRTGEESDEDLMLRTQAGDQGAFAILYERYTFPVLSYLCRLLGSREDAESIGQDVFVRALRFAPTYRYPRKFSAWLFTITRNLAINNARRRTRSPVKCSTELNLASVEFFVSRHQVGTPASDEMEKREEIARAMHAIEGLPKEQKEVIVLGIMGDLSYSQMEEILGTKAVTLRSRMFHGLKSLANVMSSDVHDFGMSPRVGDAPVH